MKKKKKIYISIIAVLIILVGLEFYFRMQYDTTYNSSCIYQYDEALMFKMASNGSYKTKDGVVNFNKYGYIGPQWEIKKDSNIYRIAVVGSCTTSGVFHIEDSISYNFPSLAQKHFDKLGYHVEIMNFGIDGEKRTYYNFKTIREDVLKFNPDLIMLEYLLPFSASHYTRDCYKGYRIDYVADLPESKKQAEEWVEKLIQYKFICKLQNNCYILKAIARNYTYRYDNSLSTFLKFADKHYVVVNRDALYDYYTLTKSVEMVKELITELNKDGIRFCLFNYGYMPRHSDLPMINLNCEFKENMYYKNDGHLNCLGQIEICNKFCEFLKRPRVIPEKYKQ